VAAARFPQSLAPISSGVQSADVNVQHVVDVIVDGKIDEADEVKAEGMFSRNAAKTNRR